VLEADGALGADEAFWAKGANGALCFFGVDEGNGQDGANTRRMENMV